MKNPWSTGSARRVDVLILDDDEPTALSLRELLELRQHDVRAVYSLEAALREIDSQPPDVLVTDLYVGDGRSDELIAYVRQTQPQVSCVLISGSDRRAWGQLVERGLVHGALRKPFDISQLIALIEDGVLGGGRP
jgi:two-component system nitrogen regulation response regulator NtrX